jgi:hypothetical protein
MRARCLLLAALGLSAQAAPNDAAFITSELIFPLEHRHNHASMIIRRAHAAAICGISVPYTSVRRTSRPLKR